MMSFVDLLFLSARFYVTCFVLLEVRAKHWLSSKSLVGYNPSRNSFKFYK